MGTFGAAVVTAPSLLGAITVCTPAQAGPTPSQPRAGRPSPRPNPRGQPRGNAADRHICTPGGIGRSGIPRCSRPSPGASAPS